MFADPVYVPGRDHKTYTMELFGTAGVVWIIHTWGFPLGLDWFGLPNQSIDFGYVLVFVAQKISENFCRKFPVMGYIRAVCKSGLKINFFN